MRFQSVDHSTETEYKDLR